MRNSNPIKKEDSVLVHKTVRLERSFVKDIKEESKRTNQDFSKTLRKRIDNSEYFSPKDKQLLGKLFNEYHIEGPNFKSKLMTFVNVALNHNGIENNDAENELTKEDFLKSIQENNPPYEPISERAMENIVLNSGSWIKEEKPDRQGNQYRYIKYYLADSKRRGKAWANKLHSLREAYQYANLKQEMQNREETNMQNGGIVKEIGQLDADRKRYFTNERGQRIYIS